MEKKRNSPAKNLPPWRVTSEGSFWTSPAGSAPPSCCPLAGNSSGLAPTGWCRGCIPTAKALVVDFCRQVDVDAMRAFQEKHHLAPDRTTSATTLGRRPPASRRKGPMGFFFHVAAQVNGKELPMGRGSGVGYIPYQVEASDEALSVILHYGLDPSTCWYILRCVFPWRRRQQVESLSFRLEVEPVRQPGQPFQIQPGERVELTHPQTGERYTLTALKLVPDTVDSNFPDMEDWDVPQPPVEAHLHPGAEAGGVRPAGRGGGRPRCVPKPPGRTAPQAAPLAARPFSL